MLFVTSFNKLLFENYGKRMVQEFSEKSDGTVNLAVIYEGDEAPDLSLKNVSFKCFNHPNHDYFIRKFGHLHEARGIRIKALENKQIQLTQDFRYDAIRFSFKVFSLLQAIEFFKPQGYFAWIDADIRCLQKFGSSELLKFFPEDNQLMSYLGRNNFPPDAPYSECGFLGFNSTHPLTLNFLNRVADVYLNGEIFTYEQWHDSWIWDQIRIEFEDNSVKFKNISGEAVITDHPFINTELGIFFDHLKGPERKGLGQSFIQDYKLRNR